MSTRQRKDNRSMYNLPEPFPSPYFGDLLEVGEHEASFQVFKDVVEG